MKPIRPGTIVYHRAPPHDAGVVLCVEDWGDSRRYFVSWPGGSQSTETAASITTEKPLDLPDET